MSSQTGHANGQFGHAQLLGRTLAVVLLAAASTHCDEPSWGLEAIDNMKTPDDPPLVCPVVTAPVDLSPERTACMFSSGASVSDTLGVTPDLPAKIPVRHVIVLMKENRSFDHLLGKLHEHGQPGVEGIPANFANPDRSGSLVGAHPARTSCLQVDPSHGWGAMHTSVDGGRMDGFVDAAADSTGTDGHFAISYNDRDLIPFYYWLASTWAINDRHFASVRSGTDPNRDFLMLATNDGQQNTGAGTPDPSTRSLPLELMNAGFTWGVYTDGTPLSGTLEWDHDDPGVHYLASFLDALDDGTLPNVAFVDGRDYLDDDHPKADLQNGEAWVRNIYAHAIASPQWRRMAIIWTYDEGGGFADHVPPPNACVARPTESDAPYFELGPRVPFAVISPYARPHYVSHVVQEHTAITRFIETVFDLPALTARDANSDALLDMFDFSCDPAMLVPPAAPESGTGACRRGA